MATDPRCAKWSREYLACGVSSVGECTGVWCSVSVYFGVCVCVCVCVCVYEVNVILEAHVLVGLNVCYVHGLLK